MRASCISFRIGDKPCRNRLLGRVLIKERIQKHIRIKKRSHLAFASSRSKTKSPGNHPLCPIKYL